MCGGRLPGPAGPRRGEGRRRGGRGGGCGRRSGAGDGAGGSLALPPGERVRSRPSRGPSSSSLLLLGRSRRQVGPGAGRGSQAGPRRPQPRRAGGALPRAKGGTHGAGRQGDGRERDVPAPRGLDQERAVP